MAQRRKATPVRLTREQRARLEDLWFLYGNYGSKSTPGNHSFIQRLIENGIDERPLNTRRTPKSQIPTPECEARVDKILSEPERTVESAAQMARRRLRIVPSPGNTQVRPRLEPNLKSILNDISLHGSGARDLLTSEDDTPDAA